MKFITKEDSSEMVGTRQNHLLCVEMMDAFGSDKWVYSDLLRIIYHPVGNSPLHTNSEVHEDPDRNRGLGKDRESQSDIRTQYE